MTRYEWTQSEPEVTESLKELKIDVRPRDQSAYETETGTSWDRGRGRDQLLWDR